MDTSAVEQNIRRALEGMADGAARGAHLCAQELLTRSSRLVPIEEATLQNTGRVVSDGRGAAVGYGSGGAEAYAARQHEDLSLAHDAGRQAKFLEQPHRQMAGDGTYLRIIGREAERGLGR